MPWEKLFAVAVLVPIAFVFLWMFFKWLTIPAEVLKKWRQLYLAVCAVHTSSATAAELILVHQAYSFGLLRQGLVRRDGAWLLHYSPSGLAVRLFWDGDYPGVRK